ncbi:MAG: regulatory protein GemA [Sphaerochaetaceae bacterium]
MNREQIVMQYRRIHAYARLAAMDDAAYRDMLMDRYGVRSSKALSGRQRYDLEKSLESLAHGKVKKYQDLKEREDKATPRQLRAIEAMWASVSRMPSARERRAALDAFCFRIAGVSVLRWISKKDVRAIMAALSAMGAARPEEYVKQHTTMEANHG